jgi:hypothetical protein
MSRRFGRALVSLIVATIVAGLLPAAVAADPVAPTYVASTSTANTSAGTTITVSVPSGVSNGDLLLAWVAPAGTAAVINSVPSGWTQIDATAARGTAYFRIAASEPSSYQWGLSASVEAVAMMAAWSGVEAADPVLAFRRSSHGSSTSHTAESPVAGPLSEVALAAFYSFGHRVVAIHLPSLPSPVLDLSTEAGRRMHLGGNPIAQNYARRSVEVLIQGPVPPEAIMGIVRGPG